MSRLAMRLPIVARRSPAITTPPSKVSATIVVPCGASSAPPGGRGRLEGSRWGAWTPTNSVNELDPVAVKAAGNRPASWWPGKLTGRPSGRSRARTPPRWTPARRRSRRARCRCRRPGRPCGRWPPVPWEWAPGPRARRRAAEADSAPGWAWILLALPLVLPVNRQPSHTYPDAAANSRNSAVASSLRSMRAPTAARVPRRGSSIGTRCSEVWPGRSKISESHDAAAAEVGTGVLRRVGHGMPDGVLRHERLDPAALLEPVEQPLLGAHVRPLDVDRPQPVVGPLEPVAVAVALHQRQLGHPVQLAGALHRVALQPGQHRLPALHHLGGVGVELAGVARLQPA